MQYNVNKQHDNFKLHAIERLRLLLDKDSFKEIGKDVSEFGTAYSDSKYQYDGVITGYGYIKNKLVFVYAQDFTVCGGTVGLKHAKKIVRVIDLAIEIKFQLSELMIQEALEFKRGLIHWLVMVRYFLRILKHPVISLKFQLL